MTIDTTNKIKEKLMQFSFIQSSCPNPYNDIVCVPPRPIIAPLPIMLLIKSPIKIWSYIYFYGFGLADNKEKVKSRYKVCQVWTSLLEDRKRYSLQRVILFVQEVVTHFIYILYVQEVVTHFMK